MAMSAMLLAVLFETPTTNESYEAKTRPERSVLRSTRGAWRRRRFGAAEPDRIAAGRHIHDRRNGVLPGERGFFDEEIERNFAAEQLAAGAGERIAAGGTEKSADVLLRGQNGQPLAAEVESDGGGEPPVEFLLTDLRGNRFAQQRFDFLTGG